jgi:hypothetical protein
MTKKATVVSTHDMIVKPAADWIDSEGPTRLFQWIYKAYTQCPGLQSEFDEVVALFDEVSRDS